MRDTLNFEYRDTQRKFQDFVYMSIVYYKDGTKKTLQNKQSFEIFGVKHFRRELANWNRLGKLKYSNSNILKYEYFETIPQANQNNKSNVYYKNSIEIKII